MAGPRRGTGPQRVPINAGNGDCRPGREFTVGILGTARKARAIATLEINLLAGADAEVYSYRNKENREELVAYTLLGEGRLRRQVETLALNAWRALGCRDGGRMDVRLNETGTPNFIEVNPLAGLHPEHSDLPIMAAMVSMSYTALIDSIMRSAAGRRFLFVDHEAAAFQQWLDGRVAAGEVTEQFHRVLAGTL